MRAQPWFIVFEGLDGTGKSTAARSVAAELGATLLATPQSELRPHRDALDALFPADSPSQTLLYAACVLEASRQASRERLLGRSVVCDRYWASTRAYADAAGRGLSLEEVTSALRVPDLTVYLTADPSVRAERLEIRGLSLHDRASLTRARELGEAYDLALCGPAVGRLERLDVTHLSPKAVVERVLAWVKP